MFIKVMKCHHISSFYQSDGFSSKWWIVIVVTFHHIDEFSPKG